MTGVASEGLLRRFLRHIADEWPATLFVAAVVSLLHGQFGWFDALDGHALLAFGNMARPARGEAPATPTAVVVTIDATAAAGRYLDRSPLLRCELLADLTATYEAAAAFAAAQPAARAPAVVVDLDLSPSPWLERHGAQDERRCEAALYELLEARAGGQRPVATVLMRPIPLGTQGWQSDWTARMQRAGVRFGRPDVPVEFGVVTKQYVEADSLSSTALAAAGLAPPAEAPASGMRHIDPRKFESGLVPVAVGADAAATRAAVSRALAEARRRGNGPVAVFFGAGFGEADTFVTPLGELYGVELHAAGLLSQVDPLKGEDHLAALLVDVLFGFVFGFIIAACWQGYYTLRVADQAFRRQLAPLAIVVLLLLVALFALLFSLASLLLLHCYGIWSSPVPMAFGMLMESFVSGSVQQGTHALQHAQHVGPRPRGIGESIRRFFLFRDVAELRTRDARAAVLVALRKAIWFGVVGWAFYVAWRGH